MCNTHQGMLIEAITFMNVINIIIEEKKYIYTHTHIYIYMLNFIADYGSDNVSFSLFKEAKAP